MAPDAPFPTTAASSPGAFGEAFEAAFAAAPRRSSASTSRRRSPARSRAPGSRPISCPSARSTSSICVRPRWAQGCSRSWPRSSPRPAVPPRRSRQSSSAAAPTSTCSSRLDTLAYLKKGGRISGPQAAIGTLLSVKPIITVRNGLVETADRPRTRAKARERVLELLSATPLERLAVLYTPRRECGSRSVMSSSRGCPAASSRTRSAVQPVGPSVGPHIGPGCLGAVVLRAPPSVVPRPGALEGAGRRHRPSVDDHRAAVPSGEAMAILHAWSCAGAPAAASALERRAGPVGPSGRRLRWQAATDTGGPGYGGPPLHDQPSRSPPTSIPGRSPSGSSTSPPRSSTSIPASAASCASPAAS